jgi:ribosomal protein S27AE
MNSLPPDECSKCGNASFTVSGETSDRYLIYKCKKCQVAYFSDQPTSQQLPRKCGACKATKTKFEIAGQTPMPLADLFR